MLYTAQIISSGPNYYFLCLYVKWQIVIQENLRFFNSIYYFLHKSGMISTSTHIARYTIPNDKVELELPDISTNEE